MALITVEEAARRLDVGREMIEGWVQQGLLEVQQRPATLLLPEGLMALVPVERCVDEEQLLEVSDTLGWLQLSQEAWDREEDE